MNGIHLALIVVIIMMVIDYISKGVKRTKLSYIQFNILGYKIIIIK